MRAAKSELQVSRMNRIAAIAVGICITTIVWAQERDPVIPEEVYDHSRGLALEYVAAPLSNSAEANRLLTKEIVPQV